MMQSHAMRHACRARSTRRTQRLAAMAQRVLLLPGRAPRPCGRDPFGNEIGVVAEAARCRAAALDDAALPDALGQQRRGIVGSAHERQHAAIARRALRLRARRASSASSCALLSGVARVRRRRSAPSRRRDARRARRPRGPSRRPAPAEPVSCGRVARLEQRVGREGVAGFRRRVDAERTLQQRARSPSGASSAANSRCLPGLPSRGRPACGCVCVSR